MSKSALIVLLWIIPQIGAVQGVPAQNVDTIIDQSIAALAGKDHFAEIKNVSFKTNYHYYRSVVINYFADDRANFKMTVGFGPYLERVFVIKDGVIHDKNFLTDGPMTNYEKTKLTCFAKLISGAFTLIRFKDELTFLGSKKYGLKEYYILERALFGHRVQFYLEKDTFLLGRMIISGVTESNVSFESSYDFSDPVETEGVTMPSYWMHNYLGTGEVEEGRHRMEVIRFNLEEEDDFWGGTNIRFGTVGIAGGVISGNVIESFLHERLKWMIMVTNVRLIDIESLKLEQHDDLVVTLEGTDYPGIYFPNKSINPARERLRPGVILAGDIGAPYVGLFMLGDVFREKYEENTEPLLTVKIRKK